MFITWLMICSVLIHLALILGGRLAIWIHGKFHNVARLAYVTELPRNSFWVWMYNPNEILKEWNYGIRPESVVMGKCIYGLLPIICFLTVWNGSELSWTVFGSAFVISLFHMNQTTRI